MTTFLFTGLIIGLVAGILGLFYRDIMKLEHMIFHPFYKLLRHWVLKSGKIPEYNKEYKVEPSSKAIYKFLAWIAFPLGFCIFCNTTWIAIIGYLIYVGNDAYNMLINDGTYNNIIDLIFGLLTAIGVQHLVVTILAKWLIYRHPDLDPDFEDFHGRMSKRKNAMMTQLEDIKDTFQAIADDQILKQFNEENITEVIEVEPLTDPNFLKEMRRNLVNGYYIMDNSGLFEIWQRDSKGKTFPRLKDRDLRVLDDYLRANNLYNHE